MSISHLKKNAMHNILGWFLPTLVFLFLTPLMIKKLGVEGFGIISLIQIITGYMNILNFGFSEAITKQVAEHSDKNPDQTMRVLWGGLALFSIFGGIGAITLLLTAHWLGTAILQIPPELQADAVNALKVGAAVFLLQMLAEYYRGTAIGFQRFDIPNISRILRISLSGILIVVSLYSDGGLTGVMIATLIGLVAGLVFNGLWMQKIFPMHRIGGPYKSVLSEIFHFSKHIFFTRLAGIVSGKLSQFFLGSISSVGNVAFYEVPTRAAEAGSVVLNRALQVFYPSFAAMNRETDIGKIRDIFTSVLSIQLLVITPFMLGVVLEGPALLTLWISKDFSQSASIILNIIAATYFISSFTNLPVFAAMSFNMPGIVSKYSIIRMAITAIVVYPLVSNFGLAGAAWTLLLSELQAFALIYETGRRVLGINLFKALARPIAVHLLVSTSLLAVYELAFRHTAWYTPLGAIPIVLAYPLLTISLGATTASDNRRLKKLVLAWR